MAFSINKHAAGINLVKTEQYELYITSGSEVLLEVDNLLVVTSYFHPLMDIQRIGSCSLYIVKTP